MPQPATQHPPRCQPELPWSEQILIRLDEIIGLLDGINTSLAVLSLAVTYPISVDIPDTDVANRRTEMDFLPLLFQKAEEPES